MPPLQAALDLAHQLCVEHHVFDRPLGLLGVWGGIVRQWLDTLLPEDAVERFVHSGLCCFAVTELWLHCHCFAMSHVGRLQLCVLDGLTCNAIKDTAPTALAQNADTHL